MTQESISSQNSNNSKTKQESSSEITTSKYSNQDLQAIKSLSTIEEHLIAGRTLTECISDKTINPSQISLMRFYNILKRNPEFEAKVLEARKIGIQTLIDKLLQIFNYQEIENPNQILWIREKTKFITYLAGKLTDLYSDNKPIKQNIDSKISISWEDNSNNLIDVSAEDVSTPTSEGN